ncbi:MAG: ATP-binding protein, partial [Armatimonadota bacterium]|nr:ATP-binding protein [Armatimonadota bacterium]
IKVAGQRVTVQTFTLPHHQKVSVAEWERYAGRDGYLKNQGFYVYREKRLIIHGTWFGLARQMELTKLARVRIDTRNGLDAEWKIDVKKSRAQPPYQVRERLRRIIETIGANSKRVYTARGRRLTADSRLPVWNRVQDKNEIVYRMNPDHPVFVDFLSRLSEEMKGDFSRIMELAGSTLPMDALFADLGGAPEKVTGNLTTEATLRYAIETTFKRLRDAGVSQDDISDMLKLAEPFRSNWLRTEEMLVRIMLEEASDVRQPE